MMAESVHTGKPCHVLMLFPTKPAQQRHHAEKLATFIREGIKVQPGFLSARLFLPEDGEKIVEHFQWMDRAAYEVYRASDLGKAAASLLVTLHPQVFFLRELEVIV
jgi:quinol monooxygenase YgiN